MIIWSTPKTAGASSRKGKAPMYDTIWKSTEDTPRTSGIPRKRAMLSSFR